MAKLYPFVPVMIVTGCPGQARRAVETGVGAFMEKPLDIPVLLERVRELLAHPDTARIGEVLRSWPTDDHPGSQG